MRRSEIEEKFKKINNAADTLKKEFVGIDNVIDSIIDNIRGWYVFPDLQTKPITICLWGLTGCGKTSLVNRLCELLDIRQDMNIYNLAKLGEEDSEELENTILENMGNSKKNRVFVFDEFQFAASIDSEGKEKEVKTSLKTIWELIDTGKFRRYFSNYYKNRISTIQMIIKNICERSPVVENGVFKNAKEIIDSLPLDKKIEFSQNFNSQESLDEYDDYRPKKYWCDLIDTCCENDSTFWLSSEILGPMYEVTFINGMQNKSYAEYMDNLRKKTPDEIYKYICKVYKLTRYGYDVDYSKSLVFVMGNIDEAYEMSYNVDPDMDPDQFRIRTERMSLVDIKEALGVRFRNEQIARLGNIMILYPSFSKKNFEDIIKLYLDTYSKSVKDKYKIDLRYDDSVYDVIYKDGVFPTHGTRPVFSSAYEIVQTKLPLVIMKSITDKKGDISRIYLTYGNEEITAKVTPKKGNAWEISFKQPLRLEDKRKNSRDENQAITAVHESGHFVMYAKLFGKLPAKLVSGAISKNANGFMQHDETDETKYMTVKDCINDIAVTLAGYVAETEIFGFDNITTGASEDLSRATEMASRMVRNCGMNMYGANEPYVTSYLDDSFSTHGGMLIKLDDSKDINARIKSIVDAGIEIARKSLADTDWRKMLLKSSEWLANNIAMPKEIMEKMLAIVPEEKRNASVRAKTYFRDILKKKVEEAL